MRYWWVNQNQTYRHEVPGGYLWSPKTRSDGRRNYFYDTMTQAQAGDLIFSFSETWIKALGVVQVAATTAPKPTEFGTAGAAWANEGWFLEVDFTELQKTVRPRDHMPILQPLMPAKYAPLQPGGDGNQGVYLTELPETLALTLGGLIGDEFAQVVGAAGQPDQDIEDDAAEAALNVRPDITATHKLQLVKARRGQGLFRSRVELVEPYCRVTGLAEKHHLRASHIMPWRFADDQEKLDGNNGLMLSPHVDHLFDQGYISFEDDGRLLLAPQVSPALLGAWSIAQFDIPRVFNAAQAIYLGFHRASLLKR